MNNIFECNRILFFFIPVLITVISELEGLSKGSVKPMASTASIVVAPALCEKLEKHSLHSNKSGSRNDPQHAAMVTLACKNALAFLNSKNPAVRCVDLHQFFFFIIELNDIMIIFIFFFYSTD